MKKIFLIDNYDSFTYNLSHYLEELGCDVTVKRNDMFELEEMKVSDFQNLVEKYDLEAHIIDGMVFDLVHAIFEERSK